MGHHLGGVGEAIHLGEQLVERLVALVVALGSSPDTPHCINLIHKDDRRGQ